MNSFKAIPVDSVHGLLSPYLNGGRKKECWRIDSIEMNGEHLRAKVSFTEYFLSPTDDGFHLSNLSGLEIVAQLRIIHIHLYLGIPLKSKELWFLKGEEKCLKPIRDYKNIIVEMELKFSSQNENNVVKMFASISDPMGGKFNYTATVLM